ncbi:MAG: hypothetical protein AAF447_27345 [Myxococcota bacterium]
MEPSILTRILAAAPGVQDAGDARFTVEDGHRLTFYLGQPGQAMVLGDLASVSLHEGFVALEKREGGGTVFVALDHVHAVAARPPKGDGVQRTGFV